MASQKGKDLLLKVDETGAGAFATVAGMRSHATLQKTSASPS